MKRLITLPVILVVFTLITSPLKAADASYKDWRNSLKAAEQARYRRDFDSMRQILEASAPVAQKLGPLSSAENAIWLAIAYSQLNMDAEALKVYGGELERIGPNPTATKVQFIRGILLTQRSLLYFRLGKYDEALASANDGKAVLEMAAGKFHPSLYEAHRTVGRIQALRKNFEQAEESMRMAVRLAETRQTRDGDVALLGPAAETVVYLTGPLPARVTMAATDLGQLLAAEGKFEEAESAYKKALEYAESAYSSDNIMRAIPLRGLAEVEYRLNHRKQFDKHTQQLFEIISENPGYEASFVKPLWLKFKSEIEQQSPRSTETLKMIEKVFAKQNFSFSEFGRSALAVSVNGDQVQDALLKLADSYIATDPEKAGLILAQIANAAVEHNKPELADSMYLRLVESQKNAADKGILIAALGKLAEQKIAEGKKNDAVSYYHQVTAAMRQKYGNDMRVADAMDTEAALLKEIGQEEAGKNLQDEAMEFRKKVVFK